MVSYVINFILLLHPDSISRYHTVNKVNQEEIIMNKQVFNPYLPSWEYVPDGEPHVFGDRLYLYGSHDRFNGELYCLNDYVCWSAPVNDLTAWKYEGVIYRGEQDPNYDIYPKPIPGMQRALYAPDVTRGPDGRYYLYYAFDFVGVISVAVSDSPAGPFEYYGDVHHQDGQVYGRKEGDEFPFDPGVLSDDDGRVWLYSGFGSAEIMKMMGGTSPEAGCDCIELEADMITIRKEAVKIIPGRGNGKGTPFENHEFYEAGSIRKFDGIYYFIYSTIQSHELAYAFSKEGPDRGFVYGGVLHSNGNIGYKGSMTPQFFWGNNHGYIERVNGKFYIFGHRQTNWHEFSRQGVAEEIRMDENGRFEMAEMTSCGLNGGPLEGKGTYSAHIACVLYPKEGACKIPEIKDKAKCPSLTQTGEDRMSDPDQYISNLNDGSVAGFKYFSFDHPHHISVCMKAEKDGVMEVLTAPDSEPVTLIKVSACEGRETFSAELSSLSGVLPLYFVWRSEGTADFFSFTVE